MKREEILKLCHFYKGEEDCPQEFKGRNEGKLWFSEKIACEIIEHGYNIAENPRYGFDNLVSMHVSKWDPYNYLSVLETYFQHSPTYKKQILNSL